MAYGTGNQRRSFSRPFVWLLFLLSALIVVLGLDYYVLSLARVYKPEAPTSGMAAELMESVKTLTQERWEGRKPGTAGNREAADWIEDNLKRCGVRAFGSLHGYRQAIGFGLGDNVLGYKSAQNKSDRWIVVGAHFDHVGRGGFFNRVHWGADDNASSVAIMLSAACRIDMLKDTNLAFVAYNTEEPPYFISVDMGSRVFVENLPKEIGDHSKVALSISLDLMGGAHWKPMLSSLFVIGTATGEGLTEVVGRAHAEGLGVQQLGFHAVERLPWGSRSPVSDYVPYLARRIPSVLLSVGRTPRYHDPQDTYDTLDYAGMEKRTAWLLNFLKEADGFKGPFTHADAVDLDLEIKGLKPFAEAASNWKTRVPASSDFTMRHFARDLERLEQPLNDSEKRVLVERVVSRFQCAMMNLPICFLID
ncbi:MAG TPA: M28 family peptidase [Bdellovibrionales bacterium]|nr:M28 family peptidase [Bdellovibrionales bacterium]